MKRGKYIILSAALFLVAGIILVYTFSTPRLLPNPSYSVLSKAGSLAQPSAEMQGETQKKVPQNGVNTNNENHANEAGEQVPQHQGPVNINTAGVTELCTLKGIGEAKANAIIQYRNENGGFASIEELKNVKGIGDKIFENISPYVTV